MPSKANAILFGALTAALLSTSYLGWVNMLCCAGVIAGGMVAVWKYTDEHKLTLTMGQGASLGFTAAILGALIALVVTTVLRLIGIRDDLAMSQFWMDRFADKMTPEQLDQMQVQMDQSPLATSLSWKALLGLAVSGAFGALGGLIGAQVFKKGGALKPEQTY